MPKKCKAVVYKEIGKPLSVEEVTVASPKSDQVMIKFTAAGVCHSDLSVTNGTMPFPPPGVLGHEGAGKIVEVGEEVTDLKVGDHIIISWNSECGKCRFCKSGRPTICEDFAKTMMTLKDGTTPFQDKDGNPIGIMLGTGVMSEYSTVYTDNVIKIDPAIPLKSVAIFGCAVMTGVGAVINTANVKAGSSVVVIGAGGIGLSAIQGAALSGALKIIAVDLNDKHLEYAKKLGATDVINPEKDGDPVQIIKKITGGGADYAFECIGLPATMEQAFESIHPGGTAVMVGVTKFTDKVSFQAVPLVLSEKCVKGCNYGSSVPTVDFPKLLGLYQRGLLKLDEMVTHEYTIDEANQAFADLEAGKNARGIIVF